jgi:DNA invertase Pin-like site-specific DNA recombinase
MRCALYARYSTDRQSKESTEDQFRVCERVSDREGLRIVARYADPAVSAGTSRRPQYQQLLAAARQGEFEFIIAEDLKRLWREQAEQWRAIKQLLDLKVHVLTASGMDSRQKTYGMMAAVYGAAAELDRQEAAYRTKRGLEGLAERGLPAGWKCYGYEPTVLPDGRKWRLVVPERAKVVRWIFAQYAAGWSPRRIAAELNRRGEPSPGSTWENRHIRRRDGKWLASALNCSILDNPIYTGEMIWNRVTWVRSHADSSKRTKVANPESEWIRHHIEELRIVPQDLWQQVRARRAARRANVSLTCTSKHGKTFRSRGGRRSKYPLSGILKCGACGGSLVVIDAYNYGCANHKDGGPHACRNDTRVKRAAIEGAVLGSLQEDFLTPARIERLKKRVARRLSERNRNRAAHLVSRQKALHAIERTINNIMGAIKQGIVTPTTKRELLAAEAERDRLLKEQPDESNVIRLLPDAVTRFERKVKDLPAALSRDADRARSILQSWLITVRLVRRKEGVFAEIKTDPGRLLGIEDCGGSGGRI